MMQTRNAMLWRAGGGVPSRLSEYRGGHFQGWARPGVVHLFEGGMLHLWGGGGDYGGK